MNWNKLQKQHKKLGGYLMAMINNLYGELGLSDM